MESLTTNPTLTKRHCKLLKPSTIEALKQKKAPPPIETGILSLPAGIESACGIMSNILQYYTSRI